MTQNIRNLLLAVLLLGEGFLIVSASMRSGPPWSIRYVPESVGVCRVETLLGNKSKGLFHIEHTGSFFAGNHRVKLHHYIPFHLAGLNTWI